MGNRKAQAAMEFLVTYGWMLMVAALVAAAMFYMGVFDTNKYVPHQCNMGLDFRCEQYSTFTNGSIRINMLNKVGEPVELVSFTCQHELGVSSSAVVSAGNSWGPGDSTRIDCPAIAAGTYFEGDMVKVDATLEYRKLGGGFTKSVQGTIVGFAS